MVEKTSEQQEEAEGAEQAPTTFLSALKLMT